MQDSHLGRRISDPTECVFLRSNYHNCISKSFLHFVIINSCVLIIERLKNREDNKENIEMIYTQS